MKFVLLLALGVLAQAESGKWHKLRRVSVVVLCSISLADAATSHGGNETNALLGRGQYGGRQNAIKFGVLGAALLSQEFVSRKKPEWERSMFFGNVGIAIVTSGAVVRNVRLR